jgi:hypothetical protein
MQNMNRLVEVFRVGTLAPNAILVDGSFVKEQNLDTFSAPVQRLKTNKSVVLPTELDNDGEL